LSRIKSRLGLLATAVVVGMSGAAMAAGPASADGPVSVFSWQFVQAYPYTQAGWSQCNADGRSYADGSTGYYCTTIYSDTGAPLYALYVGP
jgi:hypothetical protein